MITSIGNILLRRTSPIPSRTYTTISPFLTEKRPLNFNQTTSAYKGINTTTLFKEMTLFYTLTTRLAAKYGPAALEVIGKHPALQTLPKYVLASQFSGGETLQSLDPFLKKLDASNVGAVIDLAKEGGKCEDEFNQYTNELVTLIPFAASQPRKAFIAFKGTGIAPYKLLQRFSQHQETVKGMQNSTPNLLERAHAIFEACHAQNQPILVDAEQSAIHPAVHELSKRLIQQYNRSEPIVWSTYQAYLKGTYEQVKQDIQWAKENNVILGIKLVRGAYYQQEILTAPKGKAPVFETKELTDESYNNTLELCLQNVGRVHLFAATHNETSLQLLKRGLDTHNIDTKDNRIWTGQLLGMADHVTYNLAPDFNTVKYVPYGPMDHGLFDYLLRRLSENFEMMTRAEKEYTLRLAELQNRVVF